ncbi:hypothetical protein Airi01_040240 [Actinoallomurus iriomotensis]|uniref:Uncharacterized protein n=2 Tax=Actinoallomurus iriomotensis TaxID=478107 RepID=A0A9W6VQS4_9ACTN|nr:hypothetical protein Airi01_040240 [Actinoallomurus iriomotensis]
MAVFAVRRAYVSAAGVFDRGGLMSTIPLVLKLLVVATCVECVVLRRRIAFRSAREENTLLDLFSAMPPLLQLELSAALSVVVWAPLMWLSHWPLDVAAELVGVGALIVVGLALGLAKGAEAVLGAAVVFGLVTPDDRLFTGFVLPAAAAYLIRVVHTDPDFWRTGVQQMRALSRQTADLAPPTLLDRFWQAVLAAVAALPVVAVAALPMPGATVTDQILRWTAAVMVTGQLAGTLWSAAPLPRTFRHIQTGALTASVLVAAAVAASPFGGWLAHLWSLSLPGVAGGLILAVIAALAHLGYVHGRGWWQAGALLVRLPLAAAVFPFALGVAFQPGHGRIVAATLLVTAEAAAAAAGRRRPRPDHANAAWAARTAGWPLEKWTYQLRPWQYDAFLRRPGKPDHLLVRTYASFAVRSARGEMITGQDYLVRDSGLRRPLSGAAALVWADLATRALDLVDEQVVPRYPREHLETLRKAQRNTRADVAYATGMVLAYAEHWPKAYGELRNAGDLYRRIGATHRAALTTAAAAYISAAHLARPGSAGRDLETIPGPVAGDPAIEYVTTIARAAIERCEPSPGPSLDDAVLLVSLRRDPGAPVWGRSFRIALLELLDQARNGAADLVDSASRRNRPRTRGSGRLR